MTRKLFIGNLDFKTTEDDLDEMFSDFGEIEETIVIKEGNKSKGFGFVTFVEEISAKDAISNMNEKQIKGRKLTVNLAKEKDESNRNRRNGYEPREEFEDEYSKYFSTTILK